MVYEHTNSRGKKYYLHSIKSKAGMPLYYFSGKLDRGKAIDLPSQFNVIENPKTGLPMVKGK